jgi:hypothetical protein
MLPAQASLASAVRSAFASLTVTFSRGGPLTLVWHGVSRILGHYDWIATRFTEGATRERAFLAARQIGRLQVDMFLRCINLES